MAAPNRPLSPHLQIYKPQLTSFLSICHRMTGIGLAVGVLFLVCWLSSAATGPESFARIQEFNGSWLGRLLLFGWTLALFYHLCNGIRHLFWDIGKGFELETVDKTGWLVVVGTVVFTALTWFLGMTWGGIA